jgi:tRNA threonylcarbamoyl adenosine modification protein YeaZ
MTIKPNVALAIDTSAGTTVALVSGGRVLAQHDIESNMSHAESIGTAIEAVLAAAKITAAEVTEVIAGRGPAPYTGLRVGLAAATMFAAGRKLPLHGVVSLDAIALRHFAEHGQGSNKLGDEQYQAASRHLLVTTDARRKEVFWAIYQAEPFARIEGPAVNTPADLEDIIGDRPIEITTAKVSGEYVAKVAGLIGDEKLDSSAIYLRAPDAVPSAGKKVSG